MKIWNRKTQKIVDEKVYFQTVLEFLYKDNPISKFILKICSKYDFVSKIYGFLNKLKFSKYKIKPFIKHFNINEEEFFKKTSDFKSFQDFFIRKLKPSARKINFDENVLIFPCDGKFLAFENISQKSFEIKNQKFDLKSFLQDDFLYQKYKNGSMLLARLAPQDYHRFHFPVDCIPSETKLINGYLYSVNPVAIKKNINILAENKRQLTTLKTENFKDILYVEIGATNVGSINQTFFPNKPYKKAEEKGYFSLGASSIVLLFEENRVKFDQDLIDMTKNGIETLSFMGDSFAIKY
ncbi:MAG: phosphatidylserine decarboxylase [Parachlamydiales bacterium]|nr:phosphatidylserine decarboxylase [Parachlamydiales bacterium]